MNCMRKPQSICIARTRHTFSILSVGPTPKADPPQLPTMHWSVNVGKDGDKGEYTRNVRVSVSSFTVPKTKKVGNIFSPFMGTYVELTLRGSCVLGLPCYFTPGRDASLLSRHGEWISHLAKFMMINGGSFGHLPTHQCANSVSL